MATPILTALGLGGAGVLGFLGIHRWVFLGLTAILLALSFYLSVIRRRSKQNIVVFSVSAAVSLASVVYNLLRG